MPNRQRGPAGWQGGKLVEALGAERVIGGPFGSNLVSTDYVEFGVPVIRGTNMNRRGRFVGGEFVFVSTEKAAELCANSAMPGDVIVTQRGTMGQVSIVPCDSAYPRYILSQSQMGISTRGTDIDGEYLYQYLASSVFERYIRMATVQTGLPHINLTLLRNAPFFYPQVAEQRCIAGILRTWDEAIEKAERLVAMRRSAFSHCSSLLFSGRKRLGTKRANWKSAPLTELTIEATKRNGAQLGSDAVMGVNKAHGMIPMKDHVRSADLSRYKVVRAGAFAYNPMRLNIGSIAQNNHDRDVLVSPDYVAFEAKPDCLLPAYFDHLRRTWLWHRFVKTAGSGGVRIRIYYDDLANFIVDLPSLDEQRRIVELLDTGRREITLLERQRDALARQKRGLMQKLLTGEWPVPMTKVKEAAE